MSQFRSYVVICTTDPAPSEITHQGKLLDCGPANDVVEAAARPVPAWVTIAGFADNDTAKQWFDSVEDQVDGTSLLFPAHPEPVWWPPQREGDRPEWSGRLSPPGERLGVFVSVWADITHLEPFLDYAQHFKWIVEHHGGASLGSGPMPTVLKGRPGPDGDGADGLAHRRGRVRLVRQSRLRPLPEQPAHLVQRHARQRGGARPGQ